MILAVGRRYKRGQVAPEPIVGDRHGGPGTAVTKHARPIGEASKTSGVDAHARGGEAGYAGQGHEQQTEPDMARRPLVSDAVPASMIECPRFRGDLMHSCRVMVLTP